MRLSSCQHFSADAALSQSLFKLFFALRCYFVDVLTVILARHINEVLLGRFWRPGCEHRCQRDRSRLPRRDLQPDSSRWMSRPRFLDIRSCSPPKVPEHLPSRLPAKQSMFCPSRSSSLEFRPRGNLNSQLSSKPTEYRFGK